MKNKFYTIIGLLSFCLSIGSVFAQSSTEMLNESSKSENTLTILNDNVQLALYPLPTNGPLNIAFSEAQLTSPHILVYDILGNLVLKTDADRETNNVFSVFLGDKKPGIYFIKVQGEDGSSFSRRITLKP
jgi:hypothetical protein